MFNRRLLVNISGGDIPIPSEVPQACFVPSRNQYNSKNEVEYMPIFTIPENVTRLGLYWYPRSTMDATYSRLFRQVVAVAAGQRYRVDYFCWADLASNARGTLRLTNVSNGRYLDTANELVYFNNDILQAAVTGGLFMFPCNVLYCGYNREIEKLPITANIS
jgi:hypothetical protein